MVCLECAFSHTCPCNTHTHTHAPPAGSQWNAPENWLLWASGWGKIRQGGRAGARGLDRDTEAGPGIRATGWDQEVCVTRQPAPSLAHPECCPPPRALPEHAGAHAEAHSNLIHHRPHLDSPQAPRQASVVYPRSGILLDNEKGRATDTRTGSEESPRHHAARKKPGAGENVSHGSTHTEFKSRRRGRERTSRGDGNGLRLDPGGGGGGGLST